MTLTLTTLANRDWNRIPKSKNIYRKHSTDPTECFWVERIGVGDDVYVYRQCFRAKMISEKVVHRHFTVARLYAVAVATKWDPLCLYALRLSHMLYSLLPGPCVYVCIGLAKERY